MRALKENAHGYGTIATCLVENVMSGEEKKQEGVMLSPEHQFLPSHVPGFLVRVGLAQTRSSRDVTASAKLKRSLVLLGWIEVCSDRCTVLAHLLLMMRRRARWLSRS